MRSGFTSISSYIVLIGLTSCLGSDPSPFQVKTDLGQIIQLTENAPDKVMHYEVIIPESSDKAYYLLMDPWDKTGDYELDLMSVDINGNEQTLTTIVLPEIKYRQAQGWSLSPDKAHFVVQFHEVDEGGNQSSYMFNVDTASGERTLLYQSDEFLASRVIHADNSNLIFGTVRLDFQAGNTYRLDLASRSQSPIVSGNSFVEHDPRNGRLLYHYGEGFFTTDYEGNEIHRMDVEGLYSNYTFFNFILENDQVYVSEVFSSTNDNPFGDREKTSELVRFDLGKGAKKYVTKLNASSIGAFRDEDENTYFLSDYNGVYDEYFWFFSTETELYQLKKGGSQLIKLTDLPQGLRVHGYFSDSNTILFDMHNGQVQDIFKLVVD